MKGGSKTGKRVGRMIRGRGNHRKPKWGDFQYRGGR